VTGGADENPMPEPTFELTFPVLPGDIDELGHVNNIVYLRWVQEIAVAHWRAAASPEDLARFLWVILRHEVDYKQAARPGDIVRARTWVGSASRLKFERHTEMFRAADGVLLARARTLWCPVDAATMRPTPVTPEVRAVFSVEDGGV
jgi:acyl-CoA thioester hydrolase